MGESNSSFPADSGGGTTASGRRRGKLQGLAAGRLVALFQRVEVKKLKKISVFAEPMLAGRRSAQHEYFGFFFFYYLLLRLYAKKTAHYFLINSSVALSVPSSCVIFYACIYMEYYCISAVNLWGRNLLRSLRFSRQLTDTLHTHQLEAMN